MSFMTYPFTEEQMTQAAEEWGCNCGPSALAFALGKSLDEVRPAIPDFDAKRYTSPSMMKAAIKNLNAGYAPFAPQPPSAQDRTICMFHLQPSLVRIQWTGPWTKEGANPKWAYRQTHWIATCFEGESRLIFDCNGGLMREPRWLYEIIPLITSMYPRADGGWFPTHIWRLLGGDR